MEHDHAHEQSGKGRAFIIGMALNLGFVVVEVIYGFLSHSVALLSDAGHNLSDVLGLGLSWGATILATAKPSKRRTYGMRKASITTCLGKFRGKAFTASRLNGNLSKSNRNMLSRSASTIRSAITIVCRGWAE